MAPQPPLLLADSFFNVRRQFQGATLVASSETVGHEAFRVADYRRERSWWQPTAAGEMPNIDMSSNTVAATDQRALTTASATPFASSGASVSHSFAMLVKSTAALGTNQILFHTSGGASLSLWRSVASGAMSYNNNGTQADFVGSAAPTDDAYHTVILVLDGSPSHVAKVYIDGVQSGASAAYLTQQLSANTLFVVGASTVYAGAIKGKVGRMLYYNYALNAGDITNAHTALMALDRSAGNYINNTALHIWDPVFGQGGQVLSDQVGTTHLNLGKTSAVELNFDPFWGGGASIDVDLGAGAAVAPDFLWVDRGHNLWGQRIAVEGISLDGTLGSYTNRTQVARTVPALDANGNFVPGGDPLTSVCVTEEGALWMLFTAAGVLSQKHRVRFLGSTTTFTPIVTGVMLGRRHQLLNYSTTFDEDAGGRTEVSDESDAGYRATARTYSYRTIEIGQKYVGAAEYDTTFRALRSLIFDKNQPFVVCMDYGTRPERAWLYQQNGTSWSMGMARVLRETTIRGREVSPVVR